MSENSTVITIYAEAAAWVASVVATIPAHAWQQSGLGEWDLRGLVGHTSRALLTVHTALSSVSDAAVSGEAAEICSAEHYFLRVATFPEIDANDVRDRGVRAGDALGVDPAAAFNTLTDSVLREVQTFDNPLVHTIAGTMRLHDYLGTRIYELVVHGIDICVALGCEPQPPAAPLSDALTRTARIADIGGNGVPLLRAATGRGTLPSDFSVLHPRVSNGEMNGGPHVCI